MANLMENVNKYVLEGTDQLAAAVIKSQKSNKWERINGNRYSDESGI